MVGGYVNSEVLHVFSEECRRVLFCVTGREAFPGTWQQWSRNIRPSVVNRKPGKGVGDSVLYHTLQDLTPVSYYLTVLCLLFTGLSSYSTIPCRKHSKFVMSVMMLLFTFFYFKNPVRSLVVIPSNITYASIKQKLTRNS